LVDSSADKNAGRESNESSRQFVITTKINEHSSAHNTSDHLMMIYWFEDF
jgi:hypothetical protein